jgi:hypothetical protein
MPTTYKVHVDVTNRVPSDRYFIELFKQTSNIATATATLDANSGINSHTFIDLVNDSYRVRIGHECTGVTIWTDKFPINTTSHSANTQCKKPTMSAVGGLSVIAVTTNADPAQGVEVQVLINAVPGDPANVITSEGKVLLKAAYFAAPTVNPLMMTGLTAGARFVKVRAACNVTAYNDSGGSSMVIIYSDWTNPEPATVT